MKEQEFNPTIEAVTTIRNLVTAISGNWTSMKSTGALLKSDIDAVSHFVNSYGNESTKKNWKEMMEAYETERSALREIMSATIDKIKQKDGENITDNWKRHSQHVERIEELYQSLEQVGKNVMPENKMDNWDSLWKNIHNYHNSIKNEAEALGIQLILIQTNTPQEVDELTDTILKHIPMTYSKEQAHKYTDEYMNAYEELKKEASKKKNLWDRFLDILAGGIQQSPAERVMMQRWVDGEKGDSH